ncbi:hypothetical protein [Oceanospirillum beijerinckii]|uniref:hypothetical protein n=1 Tax=Oceanospirillum beijerinckii TaxID=64976 RepID=UPI0012FEFC9C|nr:hypothetical protein [Oceanospirillum beijerinckii]
MYFDIRKDGEFIAPHEMPYYYITTRITLCQPVSHYVSPYHTMPTRITLCQPVSHYVSPCCYASQQDS